MGERVIGVVCSLKGAATAHRTLTCGHTLKHSLLIPPAVSWRLSCALVAPYELERDLPTFLLKEWVEFPGST